MKINASEIRVGMLLEYKNDLWQVLKTQHVKPGKGGAFAQVEMKSVGKNTKLNERFRSSETVEKASLDENKFNYPKEHKNYLIPQILTNVNHDMNFMTEETFGPCVGIMKVKNENEAIKLMNDSPYGLTASIWTKDIEIAEKIGNQVETGTFYMNRCDYLDPALSWTGVKETGKGCSLSEIAYEKLTAPKSFHLKKEQ